jgi:IS5 family transposase
MYQRVLSQKRGDSDKIYSLHEPDVKCFFKGKQHKKYEYGGKASIAID